MEAIIKVHPSELDITLLEKLRKFIGNKENMDITISLKEYDAGYTEELNRSIELVGNSEGLISFTMEEFLSYNPDIKKQ